MAVIIGDVIDLNHRKKKTVKIKNIDFDKLDSAEARVMADSIYVKRRESHINFLESRNISPYIGNDTIGSEKWYYSHAYLECCHFSQNMMLRLAQLCSPNRKWQIVLSEHHDFICDAETKELFDLQSAKASALYTAIGNPLSADEASQIAIYNNLDRDPTYVVGLDQGTFLHPDFVVSTFRRLLDKCGEDMAHYYLHENVIDKFFAKGDYLPAKYSKPFPKDLNYALNYVFQSCAMTCLPTETRDYKEEAGRFRL
jgi:hypothetical protein